MNTTTTTTTAASRPAALAMASDLGAHTVADVVAAAHEYWPASGAGLLPGKAKKSLKAADRIHAWANAHHVTSLAELTGATAAQMLCEVTDAKSLDQAKRRETLHLHRNTLIALRGLVLVTDPTLYRRTTQRPGNDSLAAGLPELPNRSEVKGRALHDDEILLTRTLVHIELREANDPKVLAAYLLAETGVPQVPSTQLSVDSLNDRTSPTRVTFNNTWASESRQATRTLKFDTFTATAMARVTAHLREGNTPLTYSGNQPGTRGASASLNPVITRFLRRAGITTTEITAKSPELWRAHRALTKNNDITTARKLHGGKTNNLLTALKARTDEDDLHLGLLHIVDRATGTRIATVPAAEAYDQI